MEGCVVLDNIQLKYRVYLLHQLMNGIDDMIDKRSMSSEEYGHLLIEKQSQTCNNKENKMFEGGQNG